MKRTELCFAFKKHLSQCNLNAGLRQTCALWARRCGDANALKLTWTHLNYAEVCWLTSFRGKSPSEEQLDSLQRNLWSDREMIEMSEAETKWMKQNVFRLKSCWVSSFVFLFIEVNFSKTFVFIFSYSYLNCVYYCKWNYTIVTLWENLFFFLIAKTKPGQKNLPVLLLLFLIILYTLCKRFWVKYVQPRMLG